MNRLKMRKIVRKVAKKNNVTIAEVKREMQVAINSAYINPNAAAVEIPRKKGDVPTTREFIDYIANEIKYK